MADDNEDAIKPNPYTLRPIKDLGNFANRKNELEKAKDLLEQAHSSRYYNIGITGGEGVGKRSFINMLRIISEEISLLPVKIPLNSSMVNNQTQFFEEVLEYIISRGVEEEVLDESLQRKFRKVINNLNLEAGFDSPFGFSAYVGSQKEENKIPQRVLLDDLKDLTNQVKENGSASIVIIFENADLLAGNKVLLQKIRNVFSEIEGLNLVISGTNKLFEKLSKTHAPISNLFNRIQLTYFNDIKETKRALLKPLSEEDKGSFDEGCTGTLHKITEGFPYEINLIAHHMYEHYKKGKNEEITLNPEVLDDVVNDLESSREMVNLNLINKIKQLNCRQLKVLISLLEFPNVPEEWLVEYSLLNELNTLEVEQIASARKVKKSIIKQLEERGLIEKVNGEIVFKGEKFDRIFLKYYSVEENVIESIDSLAMKNLSLRNSAFQNSSKEENVINVNSEEMKNSKPRGFAIGNLHYKLLLETILEGSFHDFKVTTLFDREASQANGQRFSTVFGGINIPPGETRDFRLAPPEDSIYQDLDDAFRFRCNVKWMDNTGFVAQVKFLEEADKQKKRFVSQLRNLKEQKLEYLGYEIFEEEEITLLNKGQEYTQERNFTKALQAYDKALELNPDFALALGNKALCLKKLGQPKEALKTFNKALELKSNWPDVKTEKAILLIEGGREDEALNCINEVIKSNPGFWKAWHNKGRLMRKFVNTEEALKCFKKAFKISEALPPLHGKILTYLDLKEWESALSSIKKLQEAFSPEHEAYPPSWQLLHLKAVAFEELGRNEEALGLYRKIVEEKPDFKVAWYNKGSLERELGKEEEAVTSLMNAVNHETKQEMNNVESLSPEEIMNSIELPQEEDW